VTAVRDSMVVMPFVNMGGEAENEYFADGHY
jgi:TolB-like protein